MQSEIETNLGAGYIEPLLKLDFFASKICSRILWYSAINPKVCEEAGVGRRTSKDNILEYVVFTW